MNKRLKLDGETKRRLKIKKKGFIKYFNYKPTKLVNNLLSQKI